MSTRTIIEINHDYLGEADETLLALLRRLPSAGLRELIEQAHTTNSIRVLTQRHHSDDLEVRVNHHISYKD